jgi:hypothetical protein
MKSYYTEEKRNVSKARGSIDSPQTKTGLKSPVPVSSEASRRVIPPSTNQVLHKGNLSRQSAFDCTK